MESTNATFSLVSLTVSPEEPPVAGLGFVNETESFDSCTNVEERPFSFIVKDIDPN